MTLLWEDAWDVLNEQFQILADGVIADVAGSIWSCGHSDNESFPFRAYASFGRYNAGDEDVVVSVDFFREEDRLKYSSDVAREDGEILSDGPGGYVKLTGDVGQLRREVESAVFQIAAYVSGVRTIVVSVLREAELKR